MHTTTSTTEADARRAHLAMAFQTIVIGPAYTFGKYAAQHIEPLALLQLRLLLSAICLAPLFFMMGGFRTFHPSRRQFWAILGLTLVGLVGNQYLFMLGLRFTTPANSSLIYAISPLLVLLIAVFALRTEKLSLWKVVGVITALVGVVVIFTTKVNTTAGAADVTLGNWITLAAVLLWACYLSFGKQVVFGFNPWQMACVLMAVGSVVLLPIGVPALARFDWGTVPNEAWWGLGSLVLVNSVISYLLITYAFSKLKSSQVAIYMNLQPISAGLFSFAVLGERFTVVFLAGAFTTLLGIFILNRAQMQLSKTARIESIPTPPTQDGSADLLKTG